MLSIRQAQIASLTNHVITSFSNFRNYTVMQLLSEWSQKGSNTVLNKWWSKLYAQYKILESHGQGISQELKDQLEWIKKIRNDIEHYEFDFSVAEVELFIGKIISSVIEYSDEYEGLDLIWYVDESLKETILYLTKGYKEKLAVALAIVKEQEDMDSAECISNGGLETYWHKYECPECDNLTLITDTDSITGYKCVFCGNTESDEVEYVCDSCESSWPKSEMKCFDYTGEGDYRSMCPVCLHHPDYVKDS